MNNKIVITELSKYPEVVFISLFQNGKLVNLYPFKPGFSKINNIYIGRITSIIKNINAAFIDIGEESLFFMNISDNKSIIYTKAHNGELKEGDEILVQIDKEGTKTKNPVVKTEMSVCGKYCVCYSSTGNVKYSSKLNNAQITALKEKLEMKKYPYEITIRTNAGYAVDYKSIDSEIESLSKIMDSILKTCCYKKAPSLIFDQSSEIKSIINDIYDEEYDEVVTDLNEIYDNKEVIFGNNAFKVRLYNDEMLMLSKLYSIEKHIEDALSEKIYLKSGGFLIWQDTEAFTVIDVNSGQFQKGQTKEKTVLKINMEAAEEISRQLNIRKTSGIILVDLINMEEKESQEAVLSYFRSITAHIDNMPHIIDITKLGILEMTRKKKGKVLKQILTNL